MAEAKLSYAIQNQLELNFSYMPFINEGGLFIPTTEDFSLGDKIQIDLQLPGQLKSEQVAGKVVWITPKNSLYQILPGVGVEFIGANAKAVRDLIKANLDNTIDVGAYVCGMSVESMTPQKKETNNKVTKT